MSQRINDQFERFFYQLFYLEEIQRARWPPFGPIVLNLKDKQGTLINNRQAKIISLYTSSAIFNKCKVYQNLQNILEHIIAALIIHISRYTVRISMKCFLKRYTTKKWLILEDISELSFFIFKLNYLYPTGTCTNFQFCCSGHMYLT